MLQSLTRLWVFALATVAVLIVTLIQPVEAFATDDASVLQQLDPLAAPELEPLQAQEPEGEFIAPPPTEQTEAEPIEITPPDETGDGTLDTGSLEVVERTEFSTVYEAPDGATVEQLSLEPLNAEVDDEWVEVETDIEFADDGWAVEAHPLAPEFADAADGSGAVSLSRSGHEVSFALVGAGAGAVEAPFWWWDDWDTITYADVLPGTDLEYEVTKGAVKETVILSEAPDNGENSWTWRIRPGSLTPALLEDDSLVLRNGLDEVVMAVPTPIAWDSSQTADRWRAETPLDVELVQTGASIWRYTLTIDEDWLQDEDRVYPVSIDPTFEAGPAGRASYKSDGTTQSGVLNVGNPNQVGSTVFWRSIPTFDYRTLPDQFIHTAQMGVGFVAGQTQSYTAQIMHACAYNYSCTGTAVTDYTLGSGTTQTSGWAFSQYLVDRFEAGDRPAFMLRGHEAAGQYTFKQVDADLWVVYYDRPSISLSSPAASSPALTLTPTLRVGTTNPTGQQQYIRYQISRNSNFSDLVVNTEVTSTSWTVPADVLQPDTNYWWRASVRDAWDGHLGQSTRVLSTARTFHTNQIPMPPASSASPGTAIGTSQSPNATATAQTVTTLTPQLSVQQIADADSTGGNMRFRFRIATGLDGRSGAIATSGWLSAPTGQNVRWRVPPGMLQDGGVYSWTVDAHDGVNESDLNTWVSRFKVDLRLGTSGPSPFDAAGPVSVNLANGNAALSFSSPTVQTVGGPMGYSFSYNSQESPDANRGLRGEYFRAAADADAAGDFVFTGDPVLTRNDPAVHFRWGDQAPADSVPSSRFLARWTGFITVPESLRGQQLRFGMRHDDGARLRIGDGTSWTINNWVTGSRTTWASGTSTLTATVPIRVEYFEYTSGATAELWVRTPDGDEYIVPSDWLSRTISVLPAGWSSSMPIAGESSTWLSARVSESSVVLTDGSGKTYTYLRTSRGGFTPPAGEFGTVSLDGSGRVIFTDDTGTVFTFGTNGRVLTSTPPADARRTAAPQSVVGANGLVTSLVDPVSLSGSTYLRKVQLTYQNAAGDACPSVTDTGYSTAPLNMLCRITYPDDSTTALYYNANGQLAAILDPGDELTRFGYDAGGMLAQISDSVANDALAVSGAAQTDAMTTQIQYASGRVARVTMPAPDGVAETQRAWRAYDYGTGTTAVRASGFADPVDTATYDTAWRETSSTSAMGSVVSQQWHPTRDLVQRATDSAGRVTTTIYDAVTDRPIDRYGPAPAACFTASGTPVANPVSVSGCGIVPSHSNVAYDSGLAGLQAAFYANPTLEGAPKVVQFGLAGTGGAVNANWGTAAPVTGIPADNWSLRLMGLIRFPSAGSYRLSAQSDDGVRVWVNDVLVLDSWTPGNSDRIGSTFTAAAGESRRIRVEYFENTHGAALQLRWLTPGASSPVTVPGTALRPDYGLQTQVSATDSAPTGLTNVAAPTVTATTTYQHPWLGAPTVSTLDPNGLNLRTNVTYEQPGTGGWLRRTSRTLPAGAIAGAPASAASTATFYGDLEQGPAVCGLPAGTPQFGAQSTATGPTPASGGAVVTRSVYDIWGRVVATRSADDTDWSCTTYDARGRVTSATIVGGPGVPTIEQTLSYTPTADGVIVEQAQGSSTITVESGLTGQTRSYEDALGVVTVPNIDALTGRLLSSSTTEPGGAVQVTAFTYDVEGKMTTMTIGGELAATVTYDAAQQLQSVDYRDGASLDTVTRDGAGALVGQTWSLPGGGALTDAVVRSQAGRVLQHTIGSGSESFTSSYRYDAASRLVGATLPGHELTYQFAASGGCGPNTNAGASGNRTGMVDVWTAPGEAAVTTSTSYCYDWADRLLSSTVTNAVPDATTIADGLAASDIVYDASGDIVRLADAQFTYDALGLHASTTWDDGTTVVVQRDVTGRIIQSVTDPAGDDPAKTTSYFYAGDGDVPFARQTTEGVERPVTLPGGAMATTSGSETTWSFPSILGHTAVTSDGETSSGVQLYDPFGQPLDMETLAIGTASTVGAGVEGGSSGWHQGAQKIADVSGSYQVTEMGQRLYVPALGRFLQVDPVEGGVDNDYVWPTDPIGKSDLDGQFDWDVAFAVADVVSIGLMFIPGVGTAAGAVLRGVTIGARLVSAAVRSSSMATRLASAATRVGTNISSTASRVRTTVSRVAEVIRRPGMALYNSPRFGVNSPNFGSWRHGIRGTPPRPGGRFNNFERNWNIGWRPDGNGTMRFGMSARWIPFNRGGMGGHGHIYTFRGPNLRMTL